LQPKKSYQEIVKMTNRYQGWNYIRIALIVSIALGLSVTAGGADTRQEIQFPDIPGYCTLKCDLHMHTVFSDGLVWPTVRVDEAWREGLDCISITDHIEYTPHKEDLPKNLNRPYEIARARAEEKNILLIHGAEITRDPDNLGHFNTIFLQDVNPLDKEDLKTVFQAAAEQKVFLFWNHPGWPDGKAEWGPVQTELYEKGWMHGIEICNGDEYYPEAHQWALEKNLTMLANSDIHQPSLDSIYTSENHRTITLVFARERSLEGIRESLDQRRTVVWYKNMLIGRADLLGALLAECLIVSEPYKKTDKACWYSVKNVSHIDIVMKNAGGAGPDRIIFPAGGTINLKISYPSGAKEFTIKYEVQNFLIAPDKGLIFEKIFPVN